MVLINLHHFYSAEVDKLKKRTGGMIDFESTLHGNFYENDDHTTNF